LKNGSNSQIESRAAMRLTKAISVVRKKAASAGVVLRTKRQFSVWLSAAARLWQKLFLMSKNLPYSQL
jgi:hypothetical protein